jgi:predicted ATPase
MFTDIEGSTELLHRLGADRFAQVLQEHRDTVRTVVTEHEGVEVDTQGDGFFIAFPTAAEAVAAARGVQEELSSSGEVRVRIGLHTGAPLVVGGGYVGADVHLAARIGAAGHGGQVLLSGATQALVDAVVTPLGEHRLKDFERAVALFQLGSAVFPPLKTLSTSNLPRPASSFVGRSEQLKDVLRLLRDEGARFVTLTGPGGSGKTRLAIEVGAELVGGVRGGVFWVGLAPLRDRDLVMPTIAKVVGAKDGVAEHVGSRELVLVVDNMEHVVGAAADLADLVEACPHLRVLTTSRERLRVRGEQEYAVPPLSAAEAVELFERRAGTPATADVEELCARLDNLPLAVELAAARAGFLTPRQILDRLSRRLDLLKGGRDSVDRQQTLRTTIDWSYALLNRDEQELFARLSVFVGGADLTAAEAVAEADLDLLESLVDKSLVQFAQDRFRMLETMREYAAERLAASDAVTEISRRHAEYFLALAEQEQPTVLSVEPREALERLEAEHDNLRAAISWFESAGEVQSALRLAGAVWEFWCLRNHFGEGYARLAHLLSLDPAPTAARAAALTGAVHLAPGAGEGLSPRVRGWAEEALALTRDIGTPWDVAFAEYQCAYLFAEQGDFAGLLAAMGPVVERWREVGDEHRELQAMRLVAWAHEELGDLEQHAALHEEILRRGEATGDLEVQWWALTSLALHLSRLGRQREAVEHVHRAFLLQLPFGDAAMTDMTLVRLGIVLAGAGAAEVAAFALAVAARLHERQDFVYPSWISEPVEQAVTACRGLLGTEAFDDAWARGRAMTEQTVFELATAAVDAPG